MIAASSFLAAFLFARLRDSRASRVSSRAFYQMPSESFSVTSASKLAMCHQKIPGRSHHAFVEITRFELVTPCLQGRCSPN